MIKYNSTIVIIALIIIYNRKNIYDYMIYEYIDLHKFSCKENSLYKSDIYVKIYMQKKNNKIVYRE